MKRWIKNTIMIVVLVLLFVGDFFLVKSIKDTSSSSNTTIENNQSGGMPNDGNMTTPPEMPTTGDENTNNTTVVKSNQTNTTDDNAVPEKPEGDETPPDGYGGGQGNQSNNDSTPPEKPDGDNSQEGNGDTPPEIPTGDNTTDGNTTTSSEKPEGNMPNDNTKQSDSNTTIEKTTDNENKDSNSLIYAGIIITSSIEGLLIMYLILSAFNKNAANATFASGSVITLYLIISLILAGVLFGIKYFVPKLVVSSSSNTNETINVDNNKNDQSDVDTSGSTVVTSEETLDSKYSSTTSDESAILVKDGGNATITGTITKSGDSTNTENSEFYGVNAAILVTKGSTATISGANITTSAKGANAVFATGEDSKIYISDTTIKSTGSSSARGLDATYGGYIEASNVTISTEGGSCATVATDRGEGTVKVTDSTLSTAGKGSPIVYSTGDITLTNTKGTATGSQAIVIEGKNSATITKSSLTCYGTGNRGTADIAGVMIYQSMSGDASTGTGTLSATDSSIIIDSNSDYYKTAPMFFITNTDAVINLQNTTLKYGSNILISAKGTSEWGNSGSNGGNVELNATNQTLTGNIEIDNISTLNATFTKTTYKGTINGDNTAKSITLKLDKNSKITLTGNSYITSLDNADTTNSNIDFNGYKLYVNGKAIN